jgi:hypothetical protein
MKQSNKRFVLILLVLIVGISGYLFGYFNRPVYLISSTQVLDASSNAKLFDGDYSDRAFVSELDISELLPILRDSEWTNKNIMIKGNWSLLLDNGTKISLSYYGAFYWVDGMPGYFVVKEEDRSKYDEIIETQIRMRVIESRPQRTADEILDQL